MIRRGLSCEGITPMSRTWTCEQGATKKQPDGPYKPPAMVPSSGQLQDTSPAARESITRLQLCARKLPSVTRAYSLHPNCAPIRHRMAGCEGSARRYRLRLAGRL